MPANLRHARELPIAQTNMGWMRPFLLLALLLTVGCSPSGPSYSLLPISGTVSIDGKPVTNATVVFHSESAPTASGKTDSSGQFTLATGQHGEGVAAGEYIVQISSGAETTDASGKVVTIPIVYAENGLEVVKVAQGGESAFTFQLKSKPKSSDYLSNNPLAEP